MPPRNFTSILLRFICQFVFLVLVFQITPLSVVYAAGEECGRQAAGLLCPLNVCCSQWGFCGVTAEFCTKTNDPLTSCQSNCGMNFGPANTYKYDVRDTVIGYYEAWAPHNQGCGKKAPSSIPMTSVSHVNTAFGYIKPGTYVIHPIDGSSIEDFRGVTNLKGHTPGTKVWLSLGGWTFSDNGTDTQAVWGDLASTQAKRSQFIAQLDKFMTEWGFDGVDLDWEYPAAPDRRGNFEDTQNFLSLVRDIKSHFSQKGNAWGLSFTAPSSYWYMRWFAIEDMAKEVDWINLMTYDLHGSWDDQSSWIGPHIYAHTNMTEIKDALQLLWRNNVPAEKVNLGLGFYGRSYTLKDAKCNTPGCDFTGPGRAGLCSQTRGYLSYQDISNILETTDSKPIHDEKTGVMYLQFDHDQWVSYDSPETLKAKVEFANSVGLRGLFVWALDQDTDQHDLLNAVLSPYGLGHFANSSGDDSSWTSFMTSGCHWSSCGAPLCGAGQAAVTSVRCADPDHKIRKLLCCPLDGTPDPDFCSWRAGSFLGFSILGLCDNANHCLSDEIPIIKDKYWVDKAGGDEACLGFGQADYCCKKEEVGPQLCGWASFCTNIHTDGSPVVSGLACPQGQQPVTYRRGNCGASGNSVEFYCCDPGVDIAELSCHWNLGSPPACSIPSCGQDEVDMGLHERGGGKACTINQINPHNPREGEGNPTQVDPRLCCNRDALKINFKTLPIPLENLFFPEDLKDRPADDTQDFAIQVDDTMGGKQDGDGNSDPNGNSFAWHIIDGPEKEVATVDKRDGSHWDVFDCDQELHDGLQKAKMICTDSSAESNCFKIWLGELEGTVLKMPKGCGPGKYAMAVSLEPLTNEPLPSRFSGHKFEKRVPTVYELTFDYDFSVLSKRDSKVLLRIDYSDNPGYWKEVVAAPPKKTKRDMEIDVENNHAGSWKSYMDHTWAYEKRTTPENELHLLHERWFSIEIDDWITKMRNIDFKYEALRHNVDQIFEIPVFDESKVCQIGPVTQTLHAKLDAALNIKIQTSAQLTLIGYLGDLNSFKQSHLTFRNKGYITALLDFSANAELRFGSLNTELIGLAPLGASVQIPGIVTIGPQFKILGGLQGSVTVHANAEFQVTVSEWDWTQEYPFKGDTSNDPLVDVNGFDTSRQGVANSSLGSEFTWDVSASGQLEIHITPQITFGITFDPRFKVANSAIDFGVDTWSRLYGNAGVSSSTDFSYCYGLDAGYVMFARVSAPTLFGLNLNRYWELHRKDISLLKSENNCKAGASSKRDLGLDVFQASTSQVSSSLGYPPLNLFESPLDLTKKQ